jgi:hypothetical protein
VQQRCTGRCNAVAPAAARSGSQRRSSGNARHPDVAIQNSLGITPSVTTRYSQCLDQPAPPAPKSRRETSYPAEVVYPATCSSPLSRLAPFGACCANACRGRRLLRKRREWR